ncbi:MAG: miniconductance mechanosensitive channel, partial [Desulfotignum sp.]
MNPENFNNWFESLPEATAALLQALNIKPTPLISAGIALGLILVIAVITHLVLHKGLQIFLGRNAQKSKKIWQSAVYEG